MKNNKARFRGDLQVDGSIVGRDGQPIGFGGGGGFDPTVPIPELHFAGDPGDDTSGISLNWSDDDYELLVLGRPGSGFTGLAIVNPDDLTDRTEIYSGGITMPDSGRGIVNIWAGQIGAGHLYDPGAMFEWSPDYGVQMNADDGGMLFLTPNDGLGQGVTGLALLLSSAQVAADPDVLHFATHNGGLGLSAKPEFAMKHDGAMRWGAGGAIDPDVTLARIYESGAAFLGATDMDFLIGVGSADNIYDQAYVDLYTTGDHAFVALGDASGNEVVRLGSTISGVPALLMHSPDGTAYKLTPPNGGGAATWVAA